jgi:hypothetical protein
MRRRLLLGVLCAAWLVVPLLVAGNGWSAGGGLDGPCIGSSEWQIHQPNDTSVTQEPVAPLGFGSRCTADGPGAYHDEQIFPGVWTWVGAGFLAITPLLLWRPARRLAGMAELGSAGARGL